MWICWRSAIRVGEASVEHGPHLISSTAGAQSPKETWLRLVLIQAGLPRPQTQIPVYDEFGEVIAYLDMGWEDVKVAVEYDGSSTEAIGGSTSGISGDWRCWSGPAGS